ncbi:MAG: hypothetical protein U9N52_10275 [Campylobacterota bacterium]|nr:hypothetical protein [Campylobacterota bacterium]
MPVLILLFALFLSLSAEPENILDYSDTPEVSQNVLYSSYESFPQKVFMGQIFPITFKTLSTEQYFKEIAYTFKNAIGLRQLNEKPMSTQEGHYFYHTFYFIATKRYLQSPDVTVSLVYSDYIKEDLVYLQGKKIHVVTLNPPKDFVNVIANDFKLISYKTNHYNDEENIAVFSTQAKFSTINNFSIPGVYKQGFESNSSSIYDANMTYYSIIPKHLEQLEFSYFNLKSKKFEKLIMPIIIDDDTVSTQSNLTPRDHRHTQIKLYIAISIAVIALILFILRRRYFYLVIFLITAIYAGYIAIPIQNACVKKGSPILLLPMHKGTIFEITKEQKVFQIEGNIDGYTKVKLHNNKIGWIQNEALCTP